MIDVEGLVFSQIAQAVRDKFGKDFVSMYSQKTSAPAKFPAVTIVEQDNNVYQRARTTNIENAVSVMYEVNVFSNVYTGERKTQAKSILATIDQKFAEMGFTRTMSTPADNLQDNTITRYVARYEAVVDKDFWIYQN